MTELPSVVALPPKGHIHIVGIGGAGMSPIARVLLGRGYTVSGSDRQLNPITDALAHDGATIFSGHSAANVAGAQLVLISSAIPPDNPEVAAANTAVIPVLKRREALGALTDGYDVIAVAGTHGKTTTTALITHLLIETGHDPTYIVGGIMLNTGTNAGVGKSNWFVIEADEYDYMFLGLRPKIAVITNIEHDHPDIFPTLEGVLKSFREFVRNIRIDGTLVLVNSVELIDDTINPRPKLVGFGHKWAESYVQFNMIAKRGPLPVALSGKHNRLNAVTAHITAGLAVSETSGLDAALYTFKGVARRMEFLGETATGVSIYSDYGHHPTAIRSTLQGARDRFPKETIWAVWQPHTFSRTHLLAHDFAAAFEGADHALITDIYAAREQPSSGPSETDIADWARASGHPDARYTGDLKATAAVLRAEAKPGDVVIIFSAGDGPKIGEILLAYGSTRSQG